MINTNKNAEGSVCWKSPSNIALVKYWGKHGNQLPINPSISITLRESVTTTGIDFQHTDARKGLEIDFYFENKPAPDFGKRIQKFMESQAEHYPVIRNLQMVIRSSNTFPHSSGIASSASAFSALALDIITIARNCTDVKSERDFYNEASELARLGSGSASRSVYGGYVVWGGMKEYPEYSDNYAVPVSAPIHKNFQKIQDAILIVNAGTKKVDSSAGHNLMNNHPYAQARVQQANKHMVELHKILSNGDTERFIQIVENEALSLHGLMLSSNPGYFLFEENTIKIIERIRAFRQSSKIPVCFTLDAGPNVHLLYPDSDKVEVKEWIGSELAGFCHNQKWIDDGMGKGSVRVK